MSGKRSHLLDLCIQIQQIPAPTGSEAVRAEWVANYLRRLGLNVEVDDLSNVYACVQGSQQGQAVMVSAHTDTVFPAHIDLTVRKEASEHRVYGPGIGDNSLGVAALLWLAETLKQGERLPTDIWLVANVGEEGNGDLRGMRAAVDRLADRVGAAIVIEGMGLSRVVHRALGSRRYAIRATAPGGHSWSDYGTASAIHALVQLAADVAQLRPPSTPRTTFNIGIIRGGTSINTIAQTAELELDLRSEEPAALNALVEEVQAIVSRYQTVRWQQAGVEVTTEIIGDRPGGGIADDHPLVLAAVQSLAAISVKPQLNMRISSTDANIPLSRGIPAVCVGITDGGNAHRTDEWIATQPVTRGMRHLLTLTRWAAAWMANQG
ncbi:MAG: M20/M25/M40 family metallo-hydrolase [Caldilineaceae bacterium]|nr:M20/M25/M40 family metallo-hydrolase [Caldilineaceae bacterium]